MPSHVAEPQHIAEQVRVAPYEDCGTNSRLPARLRGSGQRGPCLELAANRQQRVVVAVIDDLPDLAGPSVRLNLAGVFVEAMRGRQDREPAYRRPAASAIANPERQRGRVNMVVLG